MPHFDRQAAAVAAAAAVCVCVCVCVRVPRRCSAGIIMGCGFAFPQLLYICSIRGLHRGDAGCGRLCSIYSALARLCPMMYALCSWMHAQ